MLVFMYLLDLILTEILIGIFLYYTLTLASRYASQNVRTWKKVSARTNTSETKFHTVAEPCQLDTYDHARSMHNKGFQAS
jgi:hypothetical protein